jgi:hypothetical protein
MSRYKSFNIVKVATKGSASDISFPGERNGGDLKYIDSLSAMVNVVSNCALTGNRRLLCYFNGVVG